MTSFESPVPYSSQRPKSAAVYCGDGAFCEHFDALLNGHLNLHRYDRLVLPGGPACFANHFDTYREEEAATASLRFLIDRHELEHVVLIAHEGCAFYEHRLRIQPQRIEIQQREDIAKAIQHVTGLSHGIRVDAYFARIREKGVVFDPYAE